MPSVRANRPSVCIVKVWLTRDSPDSSTSRLRGLEPDACAPTYSVRRRATGTRSAHMIAVDRRRERLTLGACGHHDRPIASPEADVMVPGSARHDPGPRERRASITTATRRVIVTSRV